MTDRVQWYDHTKDPAVIQLAKSIVRRARWALPDVLVEHDHLPPEIARLVPLFQERVEHLAREASRAIGAQVESVVTGAVIARTGSFHVPPGGPSVLNEARASRAHAERMALARHTLEAAAHVRTATDTHRREVEALRKASIDAVHHLNVVFHDHHRFAGGFTFTLPTTLDVDEAVYEIGLARVHEALNTPTNDETDEEGAA